MASDIILLAGTAATIGFLHTLFGPDHYIPFIVMAKARKWSLTKTTVITFLCGLGHVLSSVVLGMIGIALGIAVTKLEGIESTRGGLAGWALIAFGLSYLAWGIRAAVKNKPHTHEHIHSKAHHHHNHIHTGAHAHVHDQNHANITPWILFIIFVLGPCEPLIPLLMYPAAKQSLVGVLLVTLIFSVVTITTMTAVVIISYFGINILPMEKLGRYSHALAGAAILASGIAIKFLGL